MWAEVRNGTVHRIFHTPHGFRDADGRLHARSVFTHWTPEEQRSVGIYPVEEVDEQHSLYVKTGEVAELAPEGDRVILTIKYEPVSLSEAKAITIGAINRLKKRHQDGFFKYNGANFQCDERSRGFISGAVLEATVALINNQPYSIDFRDADNVDHTLDAEGMIALGQAAAAHVKYWFDWAKGKKGEVDQAENVETVKTIFDTLLE